MNDNSEKPLNFISWKVVKRLLAFFVSLLMVMGMITSVVYYREVNKERERLEKKEEHNVSMLVEMIADHLDSISSDLMILSENNELKALTSRDTEMNRQALAEVFLSYAKRKGLYDQIRYINEKGMEIVRVNFNNGKVTIVPENELQDKRERYYFQDTFQLDLGEIYVSPFDLNIELGRIEQPLKPIIRLGTPVFNSHGNKSGIVLLNYLSAGLLEHFEWIAANTSEGEIMLLNSDGFWLESPRAEDEWGFMYESRTNLTFGNTFPHAWQQVSSNDSGHFYSEKGLFIFTTIYPLSESMRSSSGSGKPFEPSKAWLEDNEYHWKIASWVSPETLNKNPKSLLNKLLLLNGVLLILATVTFWLLIHTRLKRKKAEEALRESELKFRSVTQTANDAIIAADSDGNIISWNKGAQNMFGYGEEEVLQKPLTLLMPERFREPHQKKFAQRTSAGKARLTGRPVELHGLRKDGSEFPLELSLGTWKKGEESFYSSIIRDITERKKAEESLKSANKELEAFSYSVSHDLRAPLRALHGFSNALLEDCAEKLSPEGQHYLNNIRKNAKNMGQLIDDLLDFSRLGRKQIETTDIDMGQLAKSSFVELKHPITKRKIQLKLHELPPAHGDPAMIRQVLMNILSNAVKFTRPVKNAVIEIDGKVENGQEIYNVKDNGVGFDMRYKDKLFGVFQRLHSVEEFEGTGVGLALVKRIVNRHGGRVWAEGKVGKGATFHFTLPLKGEQT